MKQMAIELINEAVSAGARQHKACAVLGLSCRTLRRWQVAPGNLEDKRGQARHHRPQALSAAEKEAILNVCNAPAYQSLPPSQIVPKLADQGIYMASESSFYRILKANNQLNHRGKAKAPYPHPKPLALVAYAPNEVWSWDITYLATTIRGQFLRLYLMVDVFTRMIVGWEIHPDELAEHAANLMIKTCMRNRVKPDSLVLHSDNGSPMKGATMLATLQRLGVVPSFSRPSVSDDNPYSESLFRTMKYSPTYPKRPFASIDQARQWVLTFVTWYNHQHCHSGIKFVTPAQRQRGEDQQILLKRHHVYEQAKRDMPRRWNNRATRNWQPITEVWLNPPKEHINESINLKQAA
jgi:transposase InsO family protein